MSNKPLGPMIAHTTSNSLRVWYRAGKDDRGVDLTCSLLANNLEIAHQCQIAAEVTDYITLFDISELNPDTQYQFVINKGEKVLATGIARTFASSENSNCSFITGSCRHHPTVSSSILRTFSRNTGSSDDSFKTIENLISNKEIAPKFFVMSGDQVYADHHSKMIFPFGGAKTYKEYQKHYLRAYETPYFSKLASRYPFFMCMDDHEIKNDWSMDFVAKTHKDHEKNRVHMQNGLKAYTLYQAALSSVIKDSSNISSELQTLNSVDPDDYAEDRKLYYQFDDGPTSFFVMDARMERYGSVNPPQMLAPKQMEKLKEWLLLDQNRDKVKFIVSSVPLFPDTKDVKPLIPGAPDDKWAGYPEQRFQILEFIRINNVKKVVFISGDVHVSLTAELTHASDPDFRVYQIISSGFFWPTKGLGRNNFEWDNLSVKHIRIGEKNLPDLNSRGSYIPKMLSNWGDNPQAEHQKHNFAYIETDGKSVDVQYHRSSNGERFESLELEF